jgi:hypothetical protein
MSNWEDAQKTIRESVREQGERKETQQHDERKLQGGKLYGKRN